MLWKRVRVSGTVVALTVGRALRRARAAGLTRALVATALAGADRGVTMVGRRAGRMCMPLNAVGRGMGRIRIPLNAVGRALVGTMAGRPTPPLAMTGRLVRPVVPRCAVARAVDQRPVVDIMLTTAVVPAVRVIMADLAPAPTVARQRTLLAVMTGRRGLPLAPRDTGRRPLAVGQELVAAASIAAGLVLAAITPLLTTIVRRSRPAEALVRLAVLSLTRTRVRCTTHHRRADLVDRRSRRRDSSTAAVSRPRVRKWLLTCKPRHIRRMSRGLKRTGVVANHTVKGVAGARKDPKRAAANTIGGR